MNSNLVHNILNVAGWILGTITSLLLTMGCTTSVTGALDCSTSAVIPPWLIPYIVILVTLMNFSKTIMNLMRDGFSGLFKEQPPVADNVKTVSVIAPATKSGAGEATVTVKAAAK